MDYILKQVKDKTLKCLRGDNIKSLDSLSDGDIVSLISFIENIQADAVKKGMEKEEQIELLYLGSLRIKGGRRVAMKIRKEELKQFDVDSYNDLTEEQKEEYNKNISKKISKKFLDRKKDKKENSPFNKMSSVSGKKLAKFINKT